VDLWIVDCGELKRIPPPSWGGVAEIFQAKYVSMFSSSSSFKLNQARSLDSFDDSK